MANEKEEVILTFKVDQGDMISDLEKTKKVIIGLKDEQAKLTKAYKAGSITLDEFVEDSVRLETQLKKNTARYNETTRAVAGTKNVLTELTKSNKALADQLGKTQGNVTNITQKFTSLSKETTNAFQQINVAGVSVGDLSTKLASFANPATAAIGVVGLLSAAYARSTIGAKDLEFAQNQLGFATTILTNKFAGLLSSAEDGEGVFSKILTSILFNLDPSTGALSRLGALNIEKLQDLEREEIGIRDQVNGRLEDNQELLTQIQAEQTTYNEKIGLTNEIIGNLRKNESELVDIKTKELNILNDQLALDKDNEASQTAILEKNREISNIKKDTEKRVQAILRLEDNLSTVENKRLKALREEADLIDKANRRLGVKDPKNVGVTDFSDPRLKVTDVDKTEAQLADQKRTQEIIDKGITEQIDSAQYLADATLAIEKQNAALKIKTKQQEVKSKISEDEAYLNAAGSIASSLSTLAADGSAEQKELILASIALNTTKAIVGAVSASQDILYPGNLAAMAESVGAVIAAIASAQSVGGFAGGGYTGHGGKYEPAGTVHKGEVVWSQEDVAKVGGPDVANNMRPTAGRRAPSSYGYANGGVVTSAATQEINNAVIQANALKNLPTPEVSVKEITKVQKRVTVKQTISTLKK